MKMQQGDLLIRRARKKIPKNAKEVGNVVREGERTGHHHLLEGDAIVLEHDRCKYARVGKGGATLLHPEHGPIPLPEGEYEFGVVQEWDYSFRGSRWVVD